MKRKTLINAVLVLSILAVTFIAGGIMSIRNSKVTYADTVSKPTPTKEDGFAMSEGASLWNGDPSGIRFTTYVNTEYYEELVSSGKKFHFGTIYAPATVYTGDIENFNHSVKNINDITIDRETNWGTDTVGGTVYKTYHTVQLYTLNARNNGYYGVKMLGRSYVYIDDDNDKAVDEGEYHYVDGVVRSVAQVASTALANGNTSVFVDNIPQYVLNETLLFNRLKGNDADNAEKTKSIYEGANCIGLPVGYDCSLTAVPTLDHTGSYMTPATDYDVAYSSSDEDVATIEENGTVSALGAGDTTLNANIGTVITPATCKVYAADPVTSYDYNATYTQVSQTVTYTLEGVEDRKDVYFCLNEDYINERVSAGYTNVTFSVEWPVGGGVSKKVFIIKNADSSHPQDSGTTAETSWTSSAESLALNDYFLIQSRFVRNSGSDPMDVTITAEFSYATLVTADYNSDTPITISAATQAYTQNGETITYTFDDVPYGDSTSAFRFSSNLINTKIDEGYDYVQFYISAPKTGWKRIWISSSAGYASGAITSNYGLDSPTLSLSKDVSYTININQSITASDPSDIDCRLTFTKSVKAYKRDEFGTEYYGTSSISWESYSETEVSQAVKYTFANVPKSTYCYFRFTAPFINDRIAEGYTTVALTVSSTHTIYMDLTMGGTGISSEADYHTAINGKTYTFVTKTLATDSYYYARVNHANGNDYEDITVTATFSSKVAVSAQNNGTPITISSATTSDNVITYTFADVPYDTVNWSFFNFSAEFIQAKIAAGYTKVTFGISNRGYKNAHLLRNGSGIQSKVVNDPITYNAVDLVSGDYYAIQLIHNVNGEKEADIVITATFS